MADAAAAARVPWIGDLWDVIDLQIELRGGILRSSLSDKGLRLREGDTFRLAVLFFDGTGAAVAPALSRLRWTLRDAANLEPLASMTMESPAPQTDQSQPYFLLEPNIARLGGAALDLLEESEKELPCVMDVDWTIAGNAYSSQTLPATVEFGLSVQKAAISVVVAPAAIVENPTAPSAVVGNSVDETQGIRALFDEWITAILPTQEGFLYVKDGQFHAAVPGGDCSSGEPWTPT